jgi:hypothetical protein
LIFRYLSFAASRPRKQLRATADKPDLQFATKIGHDADTIALLRKGISFTHTAGAQPIFSSLTSPIRHFKATSYQTRAAVRGGCRERPFSARNRSVRPAGAIEQLANIDNLPNEPLRPTGEKRLPRGLLLVG